MKINNIDVFGFEAAIRGMRNPLNSWSKSDSQFTNDVILGENDITLAKKLINAGPEHRKFVRYITVQFDLSAPLFFWKEFDTYKIGTVANSTSTMHTLIKTPITRELFEVSEENLNLQLIDPVRLGVRIDEFLSDLEQLRQLYLETKDKRYWKELIRWLPESFIQTRTISLNYETLYNIYKQRKDHKLTEWHEFCKFIKELPYFNLLFLEE